MDEELNEGDLGLGTTTRLDICTGTAVCSGLGGECVLNPAQDDQGTAACTPQNKAQITNVANNEYKQF